MTKKRAKKQSFSAVKAVKANARERVGQPKPEKVIAERPRGPHRKSKYKSPLTNLAGGEE